MRHRTLQIFLILLVVLGALDLHSSSAADKGRPNEFVWTSLKMGSAGHSASMALGEAIRKVTGIPVKVIPDPTDIGGWAPIMKGKAQATIRANSTSYMYGCGIGPVFGLPEWGPQRLRMVWQWPLLVSFATTKGTGVKTYADLKGKRVPDYRGWGSSRIMLMAVLAAYKIGRDEVTWVPTTGYVDGMKGLKEGTIDLTAVAPQASSSYDIDSSKGLVWLESPKQENAIDRWLMHAPFYVPQWWDIKGPGGLSPENPVWGAGLRYMVLTNAELDEMSAYLMTKGIWEGYDIYKDMHPSLKAATDEEMLDISKSMDPYHEGTVRYLKEIKVWSSKHQKYQEKMLRLEEQRMQAWKKALDEAKSKSIPINDPKWYDEENGFCIERLRSQNLVPAPDVEYHPYKK